ncbi:MAG TPA: glutathione S-transferase family protein [Rubrobacter sp.]|nr:glutathione S-transferase family protein [Rubrobacter sp.]
MNIKLYSAKGCPFARRTRVVLHEKDIDFETREVDFRNKSNEFLEASPNGKVPVVVVDGDSLYESNIVNQYLDEVHEEPKLMPGDPKARAYARIWMARANDDFYPQVFVSSMGRTRGFPEERISEAQEKLKATLSRLEEGLEGREYLADSFSLADIAHAGNFVRLHELEQNGTVYLTDYPNVASWMERIEARESFEAAG